MTDTKNTEVSAPATTHEALTPSVMTDEKAAALRQPFPPESIGKLPRRTKSGGTIQLDYVGHAATTDRLLQVDPLWTWEPVAFGDDGLPVFDKQGGLWIELTVCGVTRYGYGDAQGKSGPNAVKEAIGDAIRNAAMRFGVALDLWSKEDLDGGEREAGPANPAPQAKPKPAPKVEPPAELAELLDRGLTGESRQEMVDQIIELFEYRKALGWPDDALSLSIGKRGFENLDALANDLGELDDFGKKAYEAARQAVAS